VRNLRSKSKLLFVTNCWGNFLQKSIRQVSVRYCVTANEL